MKILLAKRRALGDTVLLSSAVELLQRSFPEAEISVLVPRAFSAVLVGNPHLKQIWHYEEGWLSLLPKFRAEKYDYLLQLHASPGARWFAWSTGATKIYFHQQNKETEKAYGKHPNALEWDGFFFRSIFGEKIKLPAPPPKIYLHAEEVEEGKKMWGNVDSQRIVFLGLGASRPTKRWLPRHFARFAELIRDRKEFVPAIAVGPGAEEAEFSGRVIDELRVKGFRPVAGGKGDFFHLAGLSVRDLAKALSSVRAYVGNDSGPKHMAAALGVQTLTVFGPEDPVEWHPYDLNQHPIFFREGLPCRKEDGGRWCGIPLCAEDSAEKHRCMAEIDPLAVFERLV